VVTRTYTYGLQRISENLSPALTGSNVWTPSFYVYDGAGSARQLTNSAGVVTDEYEYDAYGNSFTKQGTTPNNYLYRGEQYDPDLSLYYLRARYYNPLTGRFVSMDPENGIVTDPRTLHKYLYAGGDPTNRIDPTGRANSIAAPGGAAGEYAGLLAVLFVATQITANNVAHNSSSVASSLHELGENLSCSFHRDACLLSGLAGYNGSVYGSGRCLECYEACIKNDGNWPSRASRTSGSVRCDYWHF
jgi:RHS repeat-associated protein